MNILTTWGTIAQQGSAPISPLFQLELITTLPNTVVQFQGPAIPGYVYAHTVNWGDGSAQDAYFSPGARAHNYADPGTYILAIQGQCSSFAPSNTAARAAVSRILSWGLINAKQYSFGSCANLYGPLPTSAGGSFTSLVSAPVVATSKITSIPSGFLDEAINITQAFSCFQNCTFLTSVPSDLFRNCSQLSAVGGIFSGCTGLTSIPARLVDSVNNPLIGTLAQVFKNCVNLTGPAPEWWIEFPLANGLECFLNDVNLTNYLDIPDPWGGVQIPLAAPTSLVATVIDSTTIDLTWQDEDTYDFLQIEHSLDGINFEMWGGASGGDEYYRDSNLDPETHYWYRIFAFKVSKQSDYSNVADATTPANAFLMTIDTGAGNTFTLPTTGGSYDAVIEWGDTQSSSPSGIPGNILHTYDSPGVYQIAITGDFPRIYFDGGGDAQKVVSIDAWGGIQWASMENAFLSCTNMVANYTDVPDLSICTSLSRMFDYCESFNGSVDLWNTSNITDMSLVFGHTTVFNQPVPWDASSALTMSGMFQSSAFNNTLPINTGLVTDFRSMFMDNTAFNQPVDSLDTSSASLMNLMFSGATAFDQSLAAWDISNATDMSDFLSFGSGISTANYDATLVAWAAQTVTASIPVNMGTSKYTGAGSAARDILTGAPNLWNIQDGGIDVSMQLEFLTIDGDIITLPTPELDLDGTPYVYNYTVNWGDGSPVDTVVAFDGAGATHTYNPGGVANYVVTIDGACPALRNATGGSSGFKSRLRKVLKWGNTGLNELKLRECAGLGPIATDAYDSGTFSALHPLGLVSAFQGTIITTIPDNFFRDLSQITSLEYTFQNTRLANIGSDSFFGMTGVLTAESIMQDNTYLTSSPNNIFSGMTALTNLKNAFRNCPNMTGVAASTGNNAALTTVEGMYQSCGITSINSVMFYQHSALANFKEAFAYCTGLTAIPANLFNPLVLTSANNFRYTFVNCANIDGDAPALWTDFAGADGTGCFYGCNALDNIGSIPAGWKS